GVPGLTATPRRRGGPRLRARRGGGRPDRDRGPALSARRVAGVAHGRGGARPSDAARPRQRLHPHGPPVGMDARGDHRAEAWRRRRALRVREPRDAVRRDPLAAGRRRALLALGGVRGAAAAPGRCLRRRRGDLLARGVGRAADAVQKQTDGEIFWKISNGRGAMPPWKHLPEKDRWEIVNYIRTLKGK